MGVISIVRVDSGGGCAKKIVGRVETGRGVFVENARAVGDDTDIDRTEMDISTIFHTKTVVVNPDVMAVNGTHRAIYYSKVCCSQVVF